VANPGVVVWITGLPGSGKSALAEAVVRGEPGLVALRMDDLRAVATPSPAYDMRERDILYRALVHEARTLAALGHDVLIDATGNLRVWRDLARSMIPSFAEVFLRCDLATCRAREEARSERRGAPAHIYARGDAGAPVPGLGAPYEEPLRPELLLDTARLSLDEEVAAVRALLGRARVSTPPDPLLQ
jgi:adenylylsulfate kinase